MTEISNIKQKNRTKNVWSLEFVIWGLFVIWCLRFGILK